MTKKKKEEYKAITLRMKKVHFDAIQKIATDRDRSLNYVAVELLTKILRIEEKI